MRLRTKQSIPVIGWNEDMGFLIAGQCFGIDADVAKDMYHNGLVELTEMAQLKLEATNG